LYSSHSSFVICTDSPAERFFDEIKERIITNQSIRIDSYVVLHYARLFVYLHVCGY